MVTDENFKSVFNALSNATKFKKLILELNYESDCGIKHFIEKNDIVEQLKIYNLNTL
jgi:uncharacterized membrane protein